MDFIKGQESLLFIKKGESFLPVACLTSNNLSEESDTIETTTRDNIGWKTQLATNQSYSIDISGVMIKDDLDSGNSVFSYQQLRKLKRDRTIFDWKIITLAGYFVDYGKGQILSISNSNEVEDMIGFSATLKGFGKPLEDDKNYNVPEIPTYNANPGFSFIDIKDQY